MLKSYLIIVLSNLLFFLFSSCASNPNAVLLYSGKLDVNLDNKSVIFGRVVDKNTNEPLNAVNIIIDSTWIGTTTDYNGNYKITKIPAGNYTIRAGRIGFKYVKLNIKIEKGQKYLVDFFITEVPFDF